MEAERDALVLRRGHQTTTGGVLRGECEEEHPIKAEHTEDEQELDGQPRRQQGSQERQRLEEIAYAREKFL
jgi:hypothetical protein